MAEEYQEKTERATPKKRAQAKEKGQVPRSRELTSMTAMSGMILIFYFGGQHFLKSMADLSGSILSLHYGTDPIHVSRVAVLKAAKFMVPLFLTSIVLIILSSVAQGGWVIKKIEFELSKLNPMSGIKRLFSLKGLMELLKSFLKFTVGAWIVYYIINKDLEVLPSLTAMEMNELIRVWGKLIMNAVAIAFFYYLVLAFISFALEKWQHEKSLRMTKQEVKDEMKQAEGDPLVKSRIKSLQRETARRRMMQEVPKATAVITNPTHLAVAIRYEDKAMFAPKIVAKGAGAVAERIKEIAMEHGIPIIEDKPVARALFKLELNSFIPEDLYVAVARILAYIYKLKGAK